MKALAILHRCTDWSEPFTALHAVSTSLDLAHVNPKNEKFHYCLKRCLNDGITSNANPDRTTQTRSLIWMGLHCLNSPICNDIYKILH